MKATEILERLQVALSNINLSSEEPKEEIKEEVSKEVELNEEGKEAPKEEAPKMEYVTPTELSAAIEEVKKGVMNEVMMALEAVMKDKEAEKEVPANLSAEEEVVETAHSPEAIIENEVSLKKLPSAAQGSSARFFAEVSKVFEMKNK